MARRRKAAKLATRIGSRKGQVIELLPDGVLFTIISKLTLKESIRLSVLSKRWKLVWAWHPDLLFNHHTVLGTVSGGPEAAIAEKRSKFVERVNVFMSRRYNGTSKVDSLAVHFHLDKECAPQLDKWISGSISKGVEIIDLNLSEQDPSTATSTSGGGKYEFPSWLLATSGTKCSVKHLCLASCSLRDLPFCKSLITIQLQGVNISDQNLNSLLSTSCLSLERLSLQQCVDLVNPVISGRNLRLKYLIVQDCFRLEKMELCANSLVLFEYTGHFIDFHFKRVPSLASVFLNFTGDSKVDAGFYAFTGFVRDLPQLEALNLVSILTMKVIKFPEDVIAFTNIKQLVLTIFPFDDDDRLLWISYVLKAFPLLTKLQLNLFSPSFIKQSSEVERVALPECPHKHLRELEINGFYGNRHEVELLKYLIDNLVQLMVLRISPCQKVFRGFNKWFYEEAVMNWYKLRMENVCDWLREVVPCHVHLQIRQPTLI